MQTWISVLIILLCTLVVATKCDIVRFHNESSEDVDKVDIVPAPPPPVRFKNPVLNFIYPHGLSMSLQDLVQSEQSSWHYHPWKHIQLFVNSMGEEEEEDCRDTNSLEDLPDDLFTREQHSLQRLLFRFSINDFCRNPTSKRCRRPALPGRHLFLHPAGHCVQRLLLARRRVYLRRPGHIGGVCIEKKTNFVTE